MSAKRILSRGPQNPEEEPPKKFMKPTKPAPAPAPAPVASTSSAVASTSGNYMSPVPANVQLYNNLQPVRLMRVGSRRSRHRPSRQIRYALKYAQAVGMNMAKLEESFKLEEAHILVAIAIEHYAKTVSGIVEDLETELRVTEEKTAADPVVNAEVSTTGIAMETDAHEIEKTEEPAKPENEQENAAPSAE